MNLSLKQSVLAASAVVVALAAAAVATAIASRHHGDRASEAARRRHASYLLADELRQSSDDLTRLARTYVVSGGDPRWERQYLEILDIRNGRRPRPQGYERIYWDFRAVDAEVPPAGEAIALLDLMKREGFSAEELAKLAEAKANSDDLVNTETKAMNMVKGLYADADGRYTRQGAPDLATARTLMHDLDYHRAKAKIMKPVDEFLAMLDTRTAAELDEARGAQALWSTLAVAGVLTLGVVALAAMFVVRRHAGRIIGGFDAVASRIAAGDLSRPVEITMAGDEGRVLQRMDDMQRSLRAMVGEIQACATGVSTACAEISQGNQDLSERTEQQAASLQLAASTMDQLAATVRGNATSAREASQVAEGASAVAMRGGEVVGQVVDTIKGIHESSLRISSITSVIDGIAFQTNLLALNAAVEAARAGANGRGFAVVAGEVRSLARRSADAAREIKALIGASAERITHGSALADHAGATMREIVAEIRRVDSFMSTIADASREQSQGVEHVCAAVSQIDGATQQNAALVEEAAAASESLRQQACGLLGTVERFRMA